MISAAELTRALSGRWHGRYGIAPCPAHEDSSPSLSIRDSYGGPIVHCFGGCDFRDVRDELKRRGLLEARPEQWRERPKNRLTALVNDATQRTKHALELWHESKPLGASAQKYLASRGIHMSEAPDMHHALRFDPSCPFGPGERHACIVALWTDILTNEPRAVHRRPIGANGNKLDVWRALGPTGGCVIRLWPDEWVTQGLVVGEGIETTLAAATRCEHRGALMRPAWACGDAGHLMRLPPLAGVEVVTIVADNDAAGKAARSCSFAAMIAAFQKITRSYPHFSTFQIGTLPPCRRLSGR